MTSIMEFQDINETTINLDIHQLAGHSVSEGKFEFNIGLIAKGDCYCTYELLYTNEEDMDSDIRLLDSYYFKRPTKTIEVDDIIKGLA